MVDTAENLQKMVVGFVVEQLKQLFHLKDHSVLERSRPLARCILPRQRHY